MNFKGGNNMQWIKVPIAGLSVFDLSPVALLSASEIATAATEKVDIITLRGVPAFLLSMTVLNVKFWNSN